MVHTASPCKPSVAWITALLKWPLAVHMEANSCKERSYSSALYKSMACFQVLKSYNTAVSQ